eukprot:Nitzschia sp. Nitz4//scaffold3_size479765//117354//118498//NITZ4_000050-RA/size479765-augustus-gene-0.29-mRNA-1//-1//CDS//3329550608//5774//frame0
MVLIPKANAFALFLLAVSRVNALADYDVAPEELDVDASTTYNENFMKQMESPCRPETDGYFGSTYGEPVEVTYGFKVELEPLSSILEVLDVVEDKIVDAVLANAFPDVCGFNTGRRLTSASGFRFFTFKEVATCTPTESAVNFCGMFTGQVNVFATDSETAAVSVLEWINDVLTPSDPTSIHSELVTMTSEAEYLTVEGNSVEIKKKMDKQAWGWAGIVVVLFAFFTAIWWFFFRSDKQVDTGYYSSNSKRRQNKNKWSRFFRRRQRSLEYDPSEKSINHGYEAEAAVFRDVEVHGLSLRTEDQMVVSTQGSLQPEGAVFTDEEESAGIFRDDEGFSMSSPSGDDDADGHLI